MSWIFQQTPAMGTATGEAFRNVLHGTGMKTSAVMAREAIQNSVDAFKQDKAGKVRVVFRKLNLVGGDKERFIEVIDLRDEFQGRKGDLDLQPGNCLELLDDPTVPLELLYIEDYGTHGLYGDPHQGYSHFHRLLLSLGDGSKARGSVTTGGSYGYGKSVYSANSRLRTIVAYSVFDPKDSGDGRHACLMGCSYFNSHMFGGKEYTGRAWFGDPGRSQEGEVFPFDEELAHDIAEKLGFSRRDPLLTGTSILIVDCPVDTDELRRSIEEWWWPRILESELDVEIRQDEKGVSPPRPRRRADLAPYIHCFDMAIKLSDPEGSHDKAGDFNRHKGVPLGRYGFTIVEVDTDDDGNQRDSDDNGDLRLNKIALIRAPRMVVDYMEVGTLPRACAGAYVTAAEVDHALKMSEPPAHNKWDPKSARLQDEVERDQVEAIIRRLKRELKRFANEAVPPPPKSEVRLNQLERMLGKMFRPPTSPNGSGEGAAADPIEIVFCGGPDREPTGLGLRTVGEFRIGLKPKADQDEIIVSVEVRCLPVEDEGLSTDDPIQVHLSAEPGADCEADPDSTNRLTVLLNRDAKPTFGFITDPYRADWTTRVSVLVKEV